MHCQLITTYRSLSGNRPKTPPSMSSGKGRHSESTPPPRASTGANSPPLKSYINFLSNTNDDWKADEDEMLGYDDDDGDDFGLPSLSNMKRRSKRMATQQNKTNPKANANASIDTGVLSPALDGRFGLGGRRHSDSADIAVERPSLSYPMPKKSEGKILRPQYKDILQGTCDPIRSLLLLFPPPASRLPLSLAAIGFPSTSELTCPRPDRPRQRPASDKLPIHSRQCHRQRSRRHQLSHHKNQQV